MGGAGWRLLDTPPSSGSWNMALDEALMESVRAGGAPVVRFYRWCPACLSLGRNQPAAGVYDPRALRALGLGVVRRLTGGRAVLHARELTYSVALPDGALGSPQTTYAAISRALLLGLRRLGVPAELQGRGAGRPPVPSLAPCFREPAEGEVVVRGRKLVGSAQYREGGVTLQHGSLLFADDQPLVRTLMGEPAAEQDAPAVLESFLDPIPEWEVLSGALAAGFAEVAGVAVSPSPVLPEEEERATALLTRYDDLAWTWRR